MILKLLQNNQIPVLEFVFIFIRYFTRLAYHAPACAHQAVFSTSPQIATQQGMWILWTSRLFSINAKVLI